MVDLKPTEYAATVRTPSGNLVVRVSVFAHHVWALIFDHRHLPDADHCTRKALVFEAMYCRDVADAKSRCEAALPAILARNVRGAAEQLEACRA